MVRRRWMTKTWWSSMARSDISKLEDKFSLWRVGWCSDPFTPPFKKGKGHLTIWTTAIQWEGTDGYLGGTFCPQRPKVFLISFCNEGWVHTILYIWGCVGRSRYPFLYLLFHQWRLHPFSSPFNLSCFSCPLSIRHIEAYFKYNIYVVELTLCTWNYMLKDAS